MIEVKIEPAATEKAEKPFPKVMRSVVTENLVFFNSPRTGTVIKGDDTFKPGHTSNTWDMAFFKDYDFEHPKSEAKKIEFPKIMRHKVEPVYVITNGKRTVVLYDDRPVPLFAPLCLLGHDNHILEFIDCPDTLIIKNIS